MSGSNVLLMVVLYTVLAAWLVDQRNEAIEARQATTSKYVEDSWKWSNAYENKDWALRRSYREMSALRKEYRNLEIYVNSLESKP